MMNFHNPKLRCTLIVSLMAASLSLLNLQAHASVVIEIGNASLQPGRTGTVDLFIRSDAADEIIAVNYRLRITPIFETSSDLRFAPGTNSSITFRQMSTEQLDSNYIFFEKTQTANFSVSRQDPNTREVVGSDFADSGNSMIIGTTNRLLARIELEHITPTPGSSRGDYRISLVEDPASTFALDSNFDFVPIDSRSFVQDLDNNFGSGRITVTAIPEPSISALFVTCVGIVFACGNRRKRN